MGVTLFLDIFPFFGALHVGATFVLEAMGILFPLSHGEGASVYLFHSIYLLGSLPWNYT